MKRKYPALGYVDDVDGISWEVRDVRIAKHGFDLYFGVPADDHGAYKGGLPRLIATKALWNFWDTNCLKGHGFLFDLPAGRTTLKRVRRRLGFNFDEDWMEFWEQRRHDLAALRTRDFAVKYGVSMPTASDHRARMLGRQARPLGWWRNQATIELLLSDLRLREVGAQLGIGTSHVARLREQAKLLLPNLD